MSYLQHCNIWQFNMVINSGQLYCIRMGNIFSKYYFGKKGMIVSLISLSVFYHSLFVLFG